MEKHDGFCRHTQSIAIWPFVSEKHGIRNDLEERKPKEVWEIQGCITALASHPTRSTQFVCGNALGALSFWEIASPTLQPMQCQSALHRDAHMEAVCGLFWLDVDRCLSAAQDGKLNLWSLSNRFQEPLGSIQLLLNHIPRRYLPSFFGHRPNVSQRSCPVGSNFYLFLIRLDAENFFFFFLNVVEKLKFVFSYGTDDFNVPHDTTTMFDWVGKWSAGTMSFTKCRNESRLFVFYPFKFKSYSIFLSISRGCHYKYPISSYFSSCLFNLCERWFCSSLSYSSCKTFFLFSNRQKK